MPADPRRAVGASNAGQKRLEHESVVRRRLLEVHAIGRRLLEDLPFDYGPAEREPGAG